MSERYHRKLCKEKHKTLNDKVGRRKFKELINGLLGCKECVIIMAFFWYVHGTRHFLIYIWIFSNFSEMLVY